MGKTYRVGIDGDQGKPAAYLRLGAYVSDETGLPGTYTGDASDTAGVMMTTTGGFALVAGGTGTVETGKSADISVTKGAFALTAASDLTLTAKSLYLQSGRLIEQNSAVPAVPTGQVKLDTPFEFHVTSGSGNVNIDCPAEGYVKKISTGFEEVWGNQEKSNGTANSIVLGSLLDVPIGVYPSFSTWRMKIRGQETKNAVSASTMALLKSGAHITKLGNKSALNTVGLIMTGGVLGHVRKAIASYEAFMADLGNISIEITQEEIDAQLFGVSSSMMGAADLRSF